MVSGPWRSTFTTCRLVAWSLAWLLECDQERVTKERARAVTWLKKGMGGLAWRQDGGSSTNAIDCSHSSVLLHRLFLFTSFWSPIYLALSPAPSDTNSAGR